MNTHPICFPLLPRCIVYTSSTRPFTRCQNQAEVLMLAPDGEPVPGGYNCREHYQRAADEYRTTLGQIWPAHALHVYAPGPDGGPCQHEAHHLRRPGMTVDGPIKTRVHVHHKEDHHMTTLRAGEAHVETEYHSDTWSAIVSVAVYDGDEYLGDVWVRAGVPDYLEGTARAAGHTAGMEGVQPYGGQRDHWCPDALQHLEPDVLLALVRPGALAAWKEAQLD